jgi:RNA polymerase sigma-70 factor
LQGVAAHGDLGLTPAESAADLKSIITKELGASPTQGAAIKLVAGLNAEDLYLTAACAHNTDSAWNRFFTLYNDHIRNVAHGICSTSQAARELASSMLGHLFFRDAKGLSRIASYGGRGSLRTWLGTIIKHQVINQRQLKSSEALSLDSLRHVGYAKGSISQLEAAVLRNRYSEAIADSFRAASKQLNERERLVLVLRFGDEMKGAEIAQMLDVHPAQITRTIKQAQRKFRTAVLKRLDLHHGLSALAIEECIALVLAAVETSIVKFIRKVEPPTFPAQPFAKTVFRAA